MNEPVWVELDLIVAIQAEQLAIFGGAPGIRDETFLRSALDRPRNKWGYGERDLSALAGAYAYGLAKNHGFIDGNKRTAFLSIVVFLGLNGTDFNVDEAQAVVVIEQFASSHLSEDELVAWIKQSIGG